MDKKLAFVFPGQGSQYVGMGKDFYDKFALARATFQEASDALGYDVARLSFEGPAEELNKTFRTQPCILTLSTAIYRLLISNNIEPSVVAGHSLGEYSALVAAGVFKFKDAVKITEKRGQLMQDAVPEGKGLMAAILGLGRKQVDEICASIASGYVASANYNCPGQVVIAGEKHAVEEALIRCKNTGAKRTVPLTVSAPSHCSLMKDASNKLGALLDGLVLSDPAVKFVNNADAVFLTKTDEIKSSLVRQLQSPLLWEDTVKTIRDSGINIFVEVGPGKVLSGLTKRIDASVNSYNVEDQKSLEALLAVL